MKGQLHGLWACWVEYDYRLVFTFKREQETNKELIVLIDIGNHKEVY